MVGESDVSGLGRKSSAKPHREYAQHPGGASERSGLPPTACGVPELHVKSGCTESTGRSPSSTLPSSVSSSCSVCHVRGSNENTDGRGKTPIEFEALGKRPKAALIYRPVN